MFLRWPVRLRHAIRGLAFALRRDWSLAEHLVCAAVVVVAGLVLRPMLVEWCLLALCISAVIGAELFNTAMEILAQAIDRQHNPQIGMALDMAAAAVLVVSMGAAIVGSAIFGYRLGVVLAWWP